MNNSYQTSFLVEFNGQLYVVKKHHVRALTAASAGYAASSAALEAAAPEQGEDVQFVEARNRDDYASVFLHPATPSPACPQSIEVDSLTFR